MRPYTIIEKGKNEDLQAEAGKSRGTIEYEDVEEKVISPVNEAPIKPLAEVPVPAAGDDTQGLAKTEPGKAESPKQAGQPLQLEEPLLADYASNNYWKQGDGYKLEDLESNYS